MTARSSERILRLLLAQPLPRTARGLVVAAGGLVVFGVGIFDYVAGQRLSLSVFYLIPITVVAALIGSRAAYLLAVESAVVWVAAEALLQQDAEVATSLLNAVLRVATLVLVVSLVAALRSAVADAHAATQAAQGFLSTAAHQLRTPVTGLVVIAEAAAHERDPARREQLQRRLEESTGRVSRLLGLLLQLARLDQRQPIPTGRIDVRELMEREVEIARAHHPDIEFSLEATSPAAVRGEDHALGEAFSNILDNAGRHARARVAVQVFESASSVVIDVRDDGAGIPLGMEETVFERFISLDGEGGSGLGLPIARAIAGAHGGSLSYRGGFRLELPACKEPFDD